MRIIVTGGTGLIGLSLVRSLARDGHEVIVLTRDPAKKTVELPSGARAHKWDARTADGWSHLADGADAIVNLAGEPISGGGTIPSRWSDARKKRIFESRVYAGLAVVDAVEAVATKPKVVIQASAVGYYGQRHDDEILTEDAKPGSDFLGATCVAWEDATKPVEELGVRRAIVRTGLVLTMDGGPLPITVMPFRFFVGGPIGGGEQWWPWIHLYDEVAAIRFLIENEATQGAYNLTAPNPVTNKDFAKIIGRVMGRPSFMPTPGFALSLGLGEIATLVLDGQRAVPKRLLEAGFKFRYAELFYALRDVIK